MSARLHLLLAGLMVGGLLAGVIVQAQESRPGTTSTAPAARFSHLDVYVDAKDQALAAYQLELHATSDDVRIVGIEGGEHPAFTEPPYYDPRAIQYDRVILAAFNTGQNLPTGRTRVARVHVMIAGAADPEYAAQLVVAASSDGKKLDNASVTLAEGGAS